MEYRPFTLEDLPQTAKLYVDYYNTYEDGEGTIETTTKRIHQVMTREDAFGLLLEDKGKLLGFAMGYFEQYDDCQAYDLIEIVVAGERQNQGLGTAFMQELERQVRERGAMLIQLQSVNDEKHEHFEDTLGFKNAKNLVLKTKMLG